MDSGDKAFVITVACGIIGFLLMMKVISDHSLKKLEIESRINCKCSEVGGK